MKRAICAAIVGIVLLAGFFVTGTYGLSETNIQVYETAVGLEAMDGNFGFADFRLTDYPVAFYDGDNDYKLTMQNGELQMTKRLPVINSIVATAYEVDGKFEVLSPTIEKMSSLMTLAAMGMTEYTTEQHAVVLWHEAFHCYQLTNYSEWIDQICTDVNEQTIVEQVDENDRAAQLLRLQLQLLEESVKMDDVDRIRENMLQYQQVDEERRVLLSKIAAATETYYTVVEGTAYYVEAHAFRKLLPERFDEEYIDTIGLYDNGSSKYYHLGMAQCMILEKLAPEKLSGYTFSEPLIDIIYEELGI